MKLDSQAGNKQPGSYAALVSNDCNVKEGNLCIVPILWFYPILKYFMMRLSLAVVLFHFMSKFWLYRYTRQVKSYMLTQTPYLYIFGGNMQPCSHLVWGSSVLQRSVFTLVMVTLWMSHHFCCKTTQTGSIVVAMETIIHYQGNLTIESQIYLCSVYSPLLFICFFHLRDTFLLNIFLLKHCDRGTEIYFHYHLCEQKLN